MIVLMGLVVAVAFTTPAYAATLTVGTDFTCDENGLRSAINASTPGDTVTFAQACVVISLTSQIEIDKNLTIEGDINNDDVPDVRLDGGNTTRVLYVTGSAVNLNGLIIRKGLSTDFAAGIYNDGGNLSISNTEVTGNVADVEAGPNGGGILNAEGSLTITQSTIKNNSADYGGGIENYAGKLTISHSEVSGNESELTGGGINTYAESDTIIISSVVRNNTSGIGGGGIDNIGGGSLTIVNSAIFENTADSGAGIGSNSSSLLILNSTVVSNTASVRGGGIAVNSGFSDYGNQATIANTIFYGNISPSGADIYINPSAGTTETTIGNSIYGGLEGGFTDIGGNVGDSTQTLADMFTDPINDNYTLKTGSGAIDAGNSNFLREDQFGIDYNGDSDMMDVLVTDFTGDNRVKGMRVDAGAYEFGSPFDPDGNTRITPSDAIFVLNRVGQTKTSENAAADVNNDDVIDESDVNAVIERIGQSIP